MGDTAPTPGADSAFDLDAPEDQWLRRMREALTLEPLAELGPYELLEEICRGGQGVVYRARRRNQNGAAGRVALKRLLGGDFASPPARRRFEREVEAVSSLSHPGIISVIGVDVGGSQPMLAMEWVDGLSVTRWALGQDGESPHTVAEMIDMALAICDALQHAHQRGVIHRDLKPSNILVDALNRPHVLDFGLVKFAENTGSSRDSRRPIATEPSLTLSEQFIGTTAYAAPEQLRGGSAAVDTRSDVFSLGVILYEMLIGHLPFDTSGDTAVTLRAIENTIPPRPSAVSLRIDRELDAVLYTALACDPAERYQSIDALAADLRRHRLGEPVLARGPGRWYLLRTALRRHRIAAAFLATVFLLVLVGGGVAVVLASNLARAQWREHAARETAEQISGFLHEVLAAADPMGDSRPDTTARHVLDAAALRIDAAPPANPQVEAALRNTLGLAYCNLGLWNEAERHLERALALRERLYPEGHADLATSMNSLAMLRYTQRRLDDAEHLSRAALAMHTTTLGDKSAETAQDLNNLGAILLARKSLDEALTMLQRALEIRTQRFPEDVRARTETLTNLGGVLREQKRFAEAEPLMREVLASRRAALGEKHPDVAQSIDNLALIIGMQGRLKEAADLMREAQVMYRERLGHDHPDLAISLSNLAQMQFRGGDYQEAVNTLQECLRIREATLPADDARVLSNQRLLGFALVRLERPEEAEPVLRGCYERQQRRGAWDENTDGPVVDFLIRVYESLGRTEDAERFRAIRQEHPH